MNRTIHQFALRRAADAVTSSLEWETPSELASASPSVVAEYDRTIKRIAATLYRRAADIAPH